WVFQNRTYPEERKGGFLWAPNLNKVGRPVTHWETVDRVQSGDVIFSCVKQKIVAISVAKTDAYESPRPEFRKDVTWSEAGRRVDVVYEDTSPSLPVAEVAKALHHMLPQKHSPLRSDGKGNEGYLFAIPARVGRLLIERVG